MKKVFPSGVCSQIRNPNNVWGNRWCEPLLFWRTFIEKVSLDIIGSGRCHIKPKCQFLVKMIYIALITVKTALKQYWLGVNFFHENELYYLKNTWHEILHCIQVEKLEKRHSTCNVSQYFTEFISENITWHKMFSMFHWFQVQTCREKTLKM